MVSKYIGVTEKNLDRASVDGHVGTNALWKYVPVRRLFIFLERSIYEGTQWAVFEPNAMAHLWRYASNLHTSSKLAGGLISALRFGQAICIP